MNGSGSDENTSSIEVEINAASKNSLENRKDTEVNISSLATVMYTSGTTGFPKGIMFTHENIIYKRFCRAMAIPWLGEMDRFLAYLPLYHTFGRYLELIGSIFWAAEYYFLEDPSIQFCYVERKQIFPEVKTRLQISPILIPCRSTLKHVLKFPHHCLPQYQYLE